MSAHTRTTRKTVTAIRSTKGIGSLVSLTAYSAPMAKLVDEVADVIIVGDSVGMVLYGMPDTLRVTLDMMIAHGAASRGAAQACVVVDLPFSTYQESPAQAYRCRAPARRNRRAGREARRRQRDGRHDPLPDRARHPGDGARRPMPQQANATGGFRAQGMDPRSAAQVFDAACSAERADAFSVVIEGWPKRWRAISPKR